MFEINQLTAGCFLLHCIGIRLFLSRLVLMAPAGLILQLSISEFDLRITALRALSSYVAPIPDFLKKARLLSVRDF